VPFFSLSGSDFVEMFVGVGASRVRDLFKQVRKISLTFSMKIDAVGRARGKVICQVVMTKEKYTESITMDGFGTNSNVIVLAATNRADVLDKALMRAGRFDRQIFVDLPDIRERAEIFKVHLAPLKKVDGLDTS
jgi:cell division protease FtsH